MRRILIWLVLAVSLIAAKVIYPSTMDVISVTDDLAVLQTRTGHMYAIYADDLEPGDMVSCIMFTNCTWRTVEDDMVICAWAV